MKEDTNTYVENPARVLEVHDDFRPEVGAPQVDAARPQNPLGVKHWSLVEVMQHRLELLLAPLRGKTEAALQRGLATEVEARRQGLSEQERSTVVLVPKFPSLKQVEVHASHFQSNRGANSDGWRNEGRCVKETLCLRTLSETVA